MNLLSDLLLCYRSSYLNKGLDTLRQTTDLTILLSEQNVTLALALADMVYVLEHARIIWEGKHERFVDEMGQIYL